MAARRDDGANFLGGMLLGGIAGMVLGLLLAPRAGKETISGVRRRGEELTSRSIEKLEEQAGVVRDALDEVREILREAVEEGREVLREVVDEGRSESARASDELQQRWQSAREGQTPPPPVEPNA